MRRADRDEAVEVVINICMERTQENSLYSYLYLKLAKMPYFSYYFCFCFYKIGEQEDGTGSAQWGRRALVLVGRGEGR
jgi:hypothetical protein